MKAIKLCYDDPDVFQTSVTSARCDFVSDHFEAFMQMYKTQGQTFWLRFLVSFKSHVEEKFCNNQRWLTFLINHFQCVRVLNYIYVSLHKKFIEGSNTAVKKFINSLITLALHSPSYLNYNCEQWLVYIKSCKQLHNIFKNFFGISGPSEYNGFAAFVYVVYIDFFCALSAVFEQWYKANDLTEEELKKIDSKIIYWLPTFNRRLKPACFEKYIADYWKEELQRMLLKDNIHSSFSSHKISTCCDIYLKEKNIFMFFRFKDRHTLELLKILCNEHDVDDPDDNLHTITEVCLKDVSMIKPNIVVCTSHKKCFIRICHAESCQEPFLCTGGDKCIKTCETKLKNSKKQEKKDEKNLENFWKIVTAEVFPLDKKSCEVSTLAESSNKEIQTYLHVTENTDIDLPLSMLKHTCHQCLSELHNFDLNPRRTERLNRLRKKLSLKHPASSIQFNAAALRQPFYRETLFQNAITKLEKLQTQYCLSKGHDVTKCRAKCYQQTTNTVAVGTSNAFGRVILLTKTFITFPSELTSDEKVTESNGGGKSVAHKKVEMKKKSKNGDCSASSSSSRESASAVTGSASPVNNNFTKKEKDDSKTQSMDDTDDDIDTILKLIGIGEEEGNNVPTAAEYKEEDENCSKDSVETSLKDDEAVEKFFELIGVNKTSSAETNGITQNEGCDAKNLKVCAYCKKKEPHKKAFKKCSRCKEENFPVQHYYCSRDCLMEDWAESHEDEHLRFKKQSA